MTDSFRNNRVFDFLQDKQVHDKGHEISLTAMGEHKGKWFVSDAQYPQFLDILHDHLFVKRLRSMNLVEQRRADGITPLTIDLDFRYPGEKALTRAFNADMIADFLKSMIGLLNDTFDMKHSNAIRFFVTLRPQPYTDAKQKVAPGHKKDIKDGIHIVCPDFTLNGDLQSYLRHALLERHAVKECFGTTGYTNPEAEVYDKAMTGPKATGWMFYGESKPEIPPYELKYVWKYTPRSGKLVTEPAENYESKELMRLLSVRHDLKPQLVIQESKKEELFKRLAEIQKPVGKPAAATNEMIELSESIAHWEPFLRDTLPESELELVRRLVKECLNKERADGYETWMRVGWCLRNIDASPEMFDTWMEFSKKSSKFESNNVEHLRMQWLHGNMRRDIDSGKLTVRSLHFWARTDNPNAYREIMSADIQNYIRKVAMTFKGGTHHHVANIMKKLFQERYVCAIDNRSVDWYEFRDHVWALIPQGLKLKEHIHNEVAIHVSEARMASFAQSNDHEAINKEMEYKLKLLEFEKNLYSASFKENIMKECVQLFYNETFGKQLNQDPYTIGCANGVLHLKHVITDKEGRPVGYKAMLLPGKPTDYISLQTGMTPDGREAIPYVPYNATDPVYADILDFFKKLFPAPDLREYVLTLLSSCLEGANREQCFYIMTGSGGNGKSKLVELVTSVLGQYAGSLSTTALTRKRPDSGAANPDIIGVKSTRFIEMKEPDENEPLNSARMKQFSGEDLVEARGLFKDQDRFKIMGKIFMACNRMPPIHSMDGGTWRRIRVIPFDSRFVNPSETPVDESRHIYPRDDMLDEKLKQWRVPFFSLLVHYYETRYCAQGIKKVPEIVMQASTNYKNTHDAFGKFMDARVRIEAGCEPATLKKLWAVYKAWHSEHNSTGKKLTESEFKIRLNERFQVPSDGKTYINVRLFHDDEEMEAYEKELADASAEASEASVDASDEED